MLFGKRASAVYDDDFFADTRMSFGEHIEDLRTHLIRALKWFCLGLILGFVFAKPMLNYITAPVNNAMKEFYKERRKTVGEGVQNPEHRLNRAVDLQFEIPPDDILKLARRLLPQNNLPEKAPPEAKPEQITLKLLNPAKLTVHEVETLKEVDHGDNLTALSATEVFVVWMMVGLVLGLVISSPMILYELWSFVAAGLYPHERKYVYYLLPTSIGLFFAGVLVCQIFVMPAALEALLSFNAWLEIDPDLRLREWLSFAIMMPLITGVCFQTPLVMLFLGKIGIFSSADFLSKWRIAIFILLIFAAVVSPSVDAVSLFILWIPMCGLYFLGILMVKMVEKEREAVTQQEQVDEVPFDPDMMK